MKTISKYAASLGLLAGLLAFSACQSYDEPGYADPVATWQPNTTINELKTRYWDDATNYIDTIRLTDSGEHVVISGRVISSDASGNIYNSLVIQDETGALAISVRRNQLYTTFPVGQEVVIDLTDMYIGKYNGLQQLGFPEWYEKGQAWEATFMAYEFLRQHVQLNGRPQPEKIDTIACNYSQLSTTAEGLRQWQSQLVRFDNARFADGGELDFTDGSKETSNRELIVDGGETIIVRTSGYCNFYDDLLPEGSGSVVGILSYYGSSGWQLLLRSREDCIGFADSESGKGTVDAPYTVSQVVSFEQSGAGGSGWVSGYIVGAAAPGVSTVSSADDIQWGAEAVMDNTLVIAATADERDLNKCLLFLLPQGSTMRTYCNIPDNPTNVGRRMSLCGNFAKVMGTWGIDGNTGKSSEFTLQGVNIPDDGSGKPEEGGNDNPGGATVPDGDGTLASPYSVAKAVSLVAEGNTPESEVYVRGVISSIDEIDTSTYGNATYKIKDEGGSTELIIYRGYYLDKARFTSADQIKVGDKVMVYGKLQQFYEKIEMEKGNYIVSLNGQGGGDNPGGGNDNPGGGNDNPGVSGAGSQDNPYDVTAAIALGNPGTSAWVEGYIVGFVKGNSMAAATFTLPADRASNILIADNPSETDPAKCMPVELKSKSAIRNALNLMDNPEMLGVKVSIKGSLQQYMSAPGLKGASSYEIK